MNKKSIIKITRIMKEKFDMNKKNSIRIRKIWYE